MRAHVGAFQRHMNSTPVSSSQAKMLGLASTSTITPVSLFAQALGVDVDAKVDLDRVKWEGSPYKSIRFGWNQTKGTLVGESIGRQIFEFSDLATRSAFKVERGAERPCSEYDLFVEGLNRVDVKLSTEGVRGLFTWGSMKPTKADHFLLLGVTPKEIRGWLIPGHRLNHLFGMKSTGKNIRGIHLADGGVYSMSTRAGSEHAWMSPFGGTESALMERIGVESRRRYR